MTRLEGGLVPKGSRPDAEASGAGTTPRWAVLWRTQARTRLQLRDYEQLARDVESRFRTTIEPRERALTAGFASVTDRLIDHYADTPLAPAERSLLGLWINENLESLAQHPFAESNQVRSLVGRWRASVAPDALNRQPRAVPGSDEAMIERAPAATTETFTHDFFSEPGLNDASASAGAATTPGVQERVASLIERLFRRLAQALHPDRELDAVRRERKQMLMGQALQARRTSDLDTLLTLYAEHVGGLPGIVAGVDAEQLVRALERQLEGMRIALRRARSGDPFRTELVERYAGRDAGERDRRFTEHEHRLDDARDELDRLRHSLAERPGLDRALEERRAVELDKLEIAGLTGLA